jgi:uncharacterized membrane protein YphA (DoxX/SURF4 family)
MALSTSDRYPVVVDLALLLCRVIVGVIFIAHGGQKLFVHGKNGLLGDGGFEYNLALLGLCLVTLLAGPGSWALINMLKKRPHFIE